MQVATGKSIQRLYDPCHDKSRHVVVFGSGSGTNLEALLRAQQEHPSLFEIRAIFTDRLCRIHDIAALEQIPLIYHSFVNFFREKGCSDFHDPEIRHAYDQKNVELLLKCAEEEEFSIDLILLAGYMRLVHSPLLNAFPNKIINVHPADLTLLNQNGKRKYTGPNAVNDALMNGERMTCSSIILVDNDIDTGPILVSGPDVPYTEGEPVTFKRIANHQEKQKVLSDWPASKKAIELIAKGLVGIDNSRRVYINNLPQQDHGFLMEKHKAG